MSRIFDYYSYPQQENQSTSKHGRIDKVMSRYKFINAWDGSYFGEKLIQKVKNKHKNSNDERPKAMLTMLNQDNVTT